MKKAKDSSRDVKRAISFRTQKSGEQITLPPPDLQKAYVFRQGEGVVTPPPTPGQETLGPETPTENEPAPDLPSAPRHNLRNLVKAHYQRKTIYHLLLVQNKDT